MVTFNQKSPCERGSDRIHLSPNPLSLSERMAGLSVEMERLNNESHKKDSDLESFKQRANLLEGMLDEANKKIREYERIFGEIHVQLQTSKLKAFGSFK